MAHIEVHCPTCHSNEVVKFGFTVKHKQRFCWVLSQNFSKTQNDIILGEFMPRVHRTVQK